MLASADIAEDLDKTGQYIARQDGAKSIEAGKLAHAILDEILAFIRPGMRESEVKNYTLSRYEAHAVERPWHMPYIRFGEHTLLTYKQKAKEDRVLGENDIAFADIGIVRNSIEGDAGRTIAFGTNEIFAKLAEASKTIFDDALAYWKRDNPTGEALYAFVRAATEKHGFVSNLDGAGHLIGAFPHKGWKRGLDYFPQKVEKDVWVLEIQIRHPDLPYGAFFEDLIS